MEKDVNEKVRNEGNNMLTTKHLQDRNILITPKRLYNLRIAINLLDMIIRLGLYHRN